MKKTRKYRKAPENIGTAIKESEIIDDFLPKPEDLIKKDKTVKITINLSQSSVNFFKKKANKLGVPYQKMIKSVIDHYADKYKKA